MIFLDVASLFTSVLLEKALDLVLELVSSNESSSSHTSLDISVIKNGPELCLYPMISSIRIFFTRKLCTALSSCIFVIFANMHITKLHVLPSCGSDMKTMNFPC